MPSLFTVERKAFECRDFYNGYAFMVSPNYLMSLFSYDIFILNKYDNDNAYYYFRKNYDSFGKEIYFSYKIYLTK
jgi:hypothetical protein